MREILIGAKSFLVEKRGGGRSPTIMRARVFVLGNRKTNIVSIAVAISYRRPKMILYPQLRAYTEKTLASNQD